MSIFTKNIATGTDDGWNRTGSTTYDSNDAYQFIGNDGTYNYNNGYRFTNITIPSGATINSAKLTLYNYTNLARTGTTCKVKIYGVDVDDFGGFSSGATTVPSGVTRTTAETSWTLDGWGTGTIDVGYDTPDIAAQIQEIIDRAGWASGNDIGVVLINDGSSSSAYRQANEYDHDTTYCTLLTIDYTATAGPANLKTYNTNVAANIKTINTNAIANVKSLNTNT